MGSLAGWREFRLGEETIYLSDTLRFGEVTLAAREVFEALGSQGPSVASEPPPARHHQPEGAGAALVRCECGAVKPRGQR